MNNQSISVSSFLFNFMLNATICERQRQLVFFANIFKGAKICFIWLCYTFRLTCLRSLSVCPAIV